MIGPDQVVNGVSVGLICLFLGLVPGLLEALADGLENCAAIFFWRLTPTRRRRSFAPTPRWFAMAGVVLIVITFAAYYVR